MKVTMVLTSMLVLAARLALSQPDRAGSVQDNNAPSHEGRSTVIFRYLNEQGITAREVETAARRLLRQGETNQARIICDNFRNGLDTLVHALPKNNQLTDDDIRYVTAELKRMQKKIDHLISDLPFLN